MNDSYILIFRKANFKLYPPFLPFFFFFFTKKMERSTMFKSLEIYSNILWNRCLLRSENSSPNCSGSKGLKELNFHHSRIRLRFSIIYTSSYIHWKFQRNLTSKEIYHPIATFSFITKLFLKHLITMHKLRITVSVPSNSIRWRNIRWKQNF